MNPEGLTVEGLAANEQFQNYCNTSNNKDVAYWEQWIIKHPEKNAIIKEAKSLVLSLSILPSEQEIALEFSKFRKTIDLDKTDSEPKMRTIRVTKKEQQPKKTWSVAIISILLIVMAIWKLGMASEEQSHVVATTFGEVQTHTLPDGSKVILNANSTITYKDWGVNNTRTVRLIGEAFFEVQPLSKTQQFIVQTQKGNIEVLGTSFNVLQRADHLEVSLLEGAITLSIPKYPSINMMPGESVLIERDKYQRLETDVDALSAWRFKRMVFKEVPIRKIIRKLAVEFDYDITVEQQTILERKISASIPKNDPALLLEAISEIYDLKIEQQSEKIYVIK